LPKKKKGPRSLVPEHDKFPTSVYQEHWLDMRPAWRVALLELVDPFGWHVATAEVALQVRQRLAGFESMTWKEILSQAGYRNHFIRCDLLCKDARERLAALRQDDVDSVMSLGVTQRSRVFGIMEHNVLKVLWWDPNHLVYPVDRPNT
jgi:hypothetical protein